MENSISSSENIREMLLRLNNTAKCSQESIEHFERMQEFFTEMENKTLELYKAIMVPHAASITKTTNILNNLLKDSRIKEINNVVKNLLENSRIKEIVETYEKISKLGILNSEINYDSEEEKTSIKNELAAIELKEVFCKETFQEQVQHISNLNSSNSLKTFLLYILVYLFLSIKLEILTININVNMDIKNYSIENFTDDTDVEY